MRTKPINISFFIPAYNCSATIIEALDSIVDGNLKDGDELVVVNDCSTDSTAEVLENYAKKFPVKVIHHHINKGGGAARNTAIEHCTHELLFCLDSDNILAPNSISNLKDYLIETSADAAVFQHLHYFSNSTKEVTNIWTLPQGEFKKSQALSQPYTPGSGGNYMFTKESWIKAGRYPDFSGSLDTWGFGLRQLLTGSKVVVLKDSFYYHRLLDNSYYLRDAWKRRKSISLRATQLLIPFFDHINDADINYILGKKHRYDWFDNLDKRPITIIANKRKNLVWSSEENVPSAFTRQFTLRIKNKLKDIFNEGIYKK